MSGAGVRQQALAEIAREKARMSDERQPLPSIDDALDFEEQERIKEELRKIEPGQNKLDEVSFKPIEEHQTEVQSRDDGLAFNWVPYGGLQAGKKKKEKPISLNTATIWCIGRKMMAREWARAGVLLQKRFYWYAMAQDTMTQSAR